jgi:hypothetical protein
LADSNGTRNTGRLLLRIAPTGSRRFYFRYSLHGTRKMVALGIYSPLKTPGRLTLSEARERAWQISCTLFPQPALAPVVGPAQQTLGARQDFAETNVKDHVSTKCLSLLELCNAYHEWQRSLGKGFAREVMYATKNYVANSELAHLPAHSIKSTQITALLRSILDAGKGRTAGKVRSILHAAYAKSLSAGLDPSVPPSMIDPTIEVNPVSTVDSLNRHSKPRRRALSDSEFRDVWRRMRLTESNENDVALRAARLCVELGGQRCEQLIRAQITDVHLDRMLIVLEDWKGNREEPRLHVVPLTPYCLEEVEWLIDQSRTLGSSNLFASRYESKRVAAGTVSKCITEIRKDVTKAHPGIPHFQFSDLRRTIETMLSSYGVSQEHRAQLLSHGLSGIQARHYDMYDYLQEKREALALWEKHLRLVDTQINQGTDGDRKPEAAARRYGR